MSRFVILSVGFVALAACAAPLSDHPLMPAQIGAPISESDAIAGFATPGVIEFEKVKVADWPFGLGLCAPAPEICKPQARLFNAEVFVYVIRHPVYGSYLIDAGFSADHDADFGRLLRWGLSENGEILLNVSQSLGEVLEARGNPEIAGVFITHLHFDHMQGVKDLSVDVPIYAGPNAGRARHIFHHITAGPTHAALKGRAPLNILPFGDGDLVDVFGDGSLVAIHVPGHTPGSVAYLVNSTDGAHLITGDAVMSVEGWEGPAREVQTFKKFYEANWKSRARMRSLAAKIDGVTIHPGHESF